MATFSLSDSLKVRDQLEKQQYLEIQKLYQDMAKRAESQAKKLKGGTSSDKLQSTELKKLAKQLQSEAESIGVRIEESITDTLLKTSQAVVGDAQKFNSKIGLTIEGAYRRVPTDIVEVLVSGKLYEGDWSLSKAIWTDIKQTQKDINSVVAQGLALNKSSYDIAKDLEMYVDPSAKKPWDWSKVYPGTKKKVDYNAQRLARTMVGHAYQQSVVATSKNNPFVDGIKWISGHTSSTCDLCNERDGKIFPKDKLPLDHPNGKCSFALEIPKSMTDIADELADWVQGKSNPELDSWFKSLYPNISKSSVVGSSVPPHSEWIGILNSQTEEELLKMEEGQIKRMGVNAVSAIKDYTGKSYRKMNGYLREIGRGVSPQKAAESQKMSKSMLKRVSNVIEGLNKNPLDRDLVLRRGTGWSEVASLIPGNLEDSLSLVHSLSTSELNSKISNIVSEYSSFISTSGLPDRGFPGDVEVIFYAPKGTPASSIMGISFNGKKEGEVLVNAGARVRVRYIEDHPDPMFKARMFVEILV